MYNLIPVHQHMSTAIKMLFGYEYDAVAFAMH